jgi:hypothetical protein
MHFNAHHQKYTIFNLSARAAINFDIRFFSLLEAAFVNLDDRRIFS